MVLDSENADRTDLRRSNAVAGLWEQHQRP